MSRPTLSVTMSVYNKSAYLAEAIESILGQSYKPKEFIIIDDGSTDGSLQIIEQYVRINPFIKLLRNEKNMGLMYSLNLLLKEVTGNYFYGASADDIVLPNFFENAMSMLELYPDAGLCITECLFLDFDGKIIKPSPYTFTDKPCYLSPKALIETMRMRRFSMHLGIWKCSELCRAGNFIQELGYKSDFFGMLVIGFRVGICYLPQRYIIFRRDKTSFSWLQDTQPELVRRIHEKVLTLLGTPEYRDVAPSFARSGKLLIFFGKKRSEQFLGSLRHPQYWLNLSYYLLGQPLRLFRALMRRIRP